jgi:hypothetical protein
MSADLPQLLNFDGELRPPVLRLRTPALRCDTALGRGRGRRRLAPTLRSDQRLPQQRGKPVARVLPILRLRPESTRIDHDDTIGCHSIPRDRTQSAPGFIIECAGARRIEFQLNRGRNLVDVLPSRSGRTHETFFEVRLIDRDLICDSEHVPFSVATHSSVFALVAFTTAAARDLDAFNDAQILRSRSPGTDASYRATELPSHRATEPPGYRATELPSHRRGFSCSYSRSFIPL